MPRPGDRKLRALTLALLTVIAALLLGGCRNSNGSESGFTENQVSDLKAAIARIPGPTTIDVSVSTSINDYGSVAVTAEVPRDTDKAVITRILDDIEKTVWTSSMNYLGFLEFNVSPIGSRELLDARDYGGSKPELLAKYGPRPNGKTP